MANSSTFPNYGRRLLPDLIDKLANSDYSRPFVAIPRSSEPEDGFIDVNFRQLATAIDRCSWWIEQRLGRSQHFDTVGYLGPADLRYTILMFAAVKTGYKAFFTSHRNSLSAHLSLLEATCCDTFLMPQVTPLIVQQILSERRMKVIVFPELEFFMQAGSVPEYVYQRSFAEARLEPLVVLHTSGSTGIPKPIIMRHGTLSAIDAYHLIPALGGHEVIGPSFKGKRMFLAFSLFHAASMCYLLGLGIYCELTCVLPPPNIPLTARLVDRIHCSASANLQGSALLPSILVDLADDSQSFDRLKHLQYIIYAGGPLPKEVGDRVASKTRLITLTGSTEVGLPAIELSDPSDWEYVRYSSFMGYDFRPLEVEGQTLYEHFIVRDDTIELFQSVFSTFPDIDEFPMKDLYDEHPSKPSSMRLCGRTDDIIAFSTGEKFNPVTLEAVITAHPAILSALVAGHGKFQASLLVEPRKLLGDTDHLLNEIWPTIQAANKSSPTQSKIMRDFITFTKPEKPVPRAAKGTVQRMMTLELYKNEIDELYSHKPASESQAATFAGGDTIRQSLFQAIASETTLEGVGYDSNLFELGLDSLQAKALTKSINTFVCANQPQSVELSPDTIWENPSIAKLEYILKSNSIVNT